MITFTYFDFNNDKGHTTPFVHVEIKLNRFGNDTYASVLYMYYTSYTGHA